jgi:hypothetical protein
MIRYRFSQLEEAGRLVSATLLMSTDLGRASSTVLALLAPAAESEHATYWRFDPTVMRLRALASWSASKRTASMRHSGMAPRTASLSLSNAGQVWHTRKPLWASALLDMDLSAGIRLHGGVWFAVKSDTSIYGVIELTGRALDGSIPQNLFLIERLGSRLGHALEERRCASGLG